MMEEKSRKRKEHQRKEAENRKLKKDLKEIQCGGVKIRHFEGSSPRQGKHNK